MPDKQLVDFPPILFVDSLNTRVEAFPIIINEYLEREIYPPFCPLVFLYFEQVQNINMIRCSESLGAVELVNPPYDQVQPVIRSRGVG